MEHTANFKNPPAFQGRFYTPSLEILHVNQENHNKVKREPADNLIMTSVLNDYQAVIVPKGLGIKYVFHGKESYSVQGKQKTITKGTYFLVNDSVPAFDVLIQQQRTSSICIDIAPHLVNDVLQQLLMADEIDNQAPIKEFLLSPDLLVRKSRASKFLDFVLQQAYFASREERFEELNLELIYELTGLLIRDNLELIGSFYKINSARRATRQELFSKLLLGKEILEGCIFERIQMKDVAIACGISEFRFYRLFRQCFGKSPYNYLLSRRISESIQLKKNGHTWEEISQLLDFTDLPAFSKIFKKFTGFPPSLAQL